MRMFSPRVSAVCSYAIALLISINASAGINEDLLQAISNNDAVKAKAFLANGADVHIKDRNGNTTLINAIRSGGKIEIVNALLDKGVDVNAKGMNPAFPD